MSVDRRHGRARRRLHQFHRSIRRGLRRHKPWARHASFATRCGPAGRDSRARSCRHNPCGTGRGAAVPARRSARNPRRRRARGSPTRRSRRRRARRTIVRAGRRPPSGRRSIGLCTRPRPLKWMNSRTVGFFFPLARSTRSRMPCRPDIAAISSSVNASSMPLRGEVEVERLGQKRQRVDLERQLLDHRPFVLGLRLGRGGHGVDAVA